MDGGTIYWDSFTYLKSGNLKKGIKMGITYREAKRILDKQDEARDVINSYRGMETLGKRLQLRNNRELILKLFEIEDDVAIVEVFSHLKALYEEQWGDAEVTAPPEFPGELKEDAKDTKSSSADASKKSKVDAVQSVPVTAGN